MSVVRRREQISECKDKDKGISMRSVLSLATFYIGRVSSLRTYTVCSVSCCFSEISTAPIFKVEWMSFEYASFHKLVIAKHF